MYVLPPKLTHWKVDIISEADAKNRMAEAIFNLMLIPSLNETMAQNFFQSGFPSFQIIAESSAEEIMKVPGYTDEKQAEDLIAEAQQLVLDYKDKEIPVKFPKKEEESTQKISASDAERKLKEELSKLDSKDSDESSVKSESKEAKEEVEETEEKVKKEEKEVSAQKEAPEQDEASSTTLSFEETQKKNEAENTKETSKKGRLIYRESLRTGKRTSR